MLKICLVLAVVAATASGQCESGWSSFGQSCYLLFPGAQSFDAHRANCESLGGWLVSIGSEAENAFVNQLQQAVCGSGACQAFIGLRTDSAGEFTSWLDSTPFGGSAYSNWNSGEPNNAFGSESCAELIQDSGKWNDISCGTNRQAMCEKPPPATWCGTDWSPFGQSCYRLFTSPQSFDAHRVNCENLGGWLVCIGSAEENNFANQVQQAGCGSGACQAYVGLLWRAGQVSNWLDGAPFIWNTYTNWNRGEPNNLGGIENCVELTKDSGKWYDVPCSKNQSAMCEKPQPATWCSAGWWPFGQCCYRLLTALQSFDVHRSDCQTSGGQLASIRSAAENNFVQQLPQSACSGASCPAAYIGLHRNNGGQFASWLEDTPFGGTFYSNWNSGEPNNVGDSENCGEIVLRTGKWNDIPCDSPRTAVCENCQPPAATSTTTESTTAPSTTASTTTTTTTTESTTAPSTTASTIRPTSSTSTTNGKFDCRTVRTNVNCGAANGPAACDAQCRLFKYGRGICYNFGTTSCPGYPLGSKGCLCYDTLDCRTLRTQVNCAAANAATSCTNWCKLFHWTQGACTTFQSSWTCPGYAAGQAACLCQ